MEGEPLIVILSASEGSRCPVREIFDATAAQYDEGMAFTEKVFGDGPAWACWASKISITFHLLLQSLKKQKE